MLSPSTGLTALKLIAPDSRGEDLLQRGSAHVLTVDEGHVEGDNGSRTKALVAIPLKGMLGYWQTFRATALVLHRAACRAAPTAAASVVPPPRAGNQSLDNLTVNGNCIQTRSRRSVSQTALAIQEPEPRLHIKRRLAAVAFADIAGFSRLMAANDLETVRRWKALRKEVLEPHIARHEGRVAEIAGDALLVEFPSVVNAVQWATDVQRAQQTRHSQSDPFSLQLRIGINIEDIIDDEGILQGDGVNIAARIHQAAEPGQIVVTATVRDYVMNRLPVTFRDLGTPALKNIARPIRVFAVDWIGHEGLPKEQSYLQWSSKPTIAVLPFRNLGGTAEDNYFGEGITDDIITGLSSSRSLYVIARSSTLRYRDHNKDFRQIAGELDVRYVLDGTVRRQEKRLRINAELMDVVGNRPIWSHRFEGANDDLFEFQDQIAASIIGTIEPRVRAAEAARASDRPTENLDAYNCVLKALSRLYQFTAESYREAGALLDRAILLDPSYAQAFAYLAWWLNFQIGEGRSQDIHKDRLRAVTASQRAIELDSEDSFVLAVGGHILSFIAGKPQQAVELF